jgi:peptidoglycan/LPS O-acetylase OafA/YrhL
MARLASPLRLATGAGVAGAALGVVAFRHGSLDVGYALGEVGLGFARVAFPFLIGVVLLRVERRLGDWNLSPYVAAALLCGVLARPEGGGATYDLVCVMLVFPAIILFAARATFNNSLDALSIRLGALSYPLYATHFPIVVVLSRAARTHTDPHLAMPLIGFLAFATAVGFAFCVAVPYDIRVRAWLKNVQVIRPHPVAAQDSARDS